MKIRLASRLFMVVIAGFCFLQLSAGSLFAEEETVISSDDEVVDAASSTVSTSTVIIDSASETEEVEVASDTGETQVATDSAWVNNPPPWFPPPPVFFPPPFFFPPPIGGFFGGLINMILQILFGLGNGFGGFNPPPWNAPWNPPPWNPPPWINGNDDGNQTQVASTGGELTTTSTVGSSGLTAADIKSKYGLDITDAAYERDQWGDIFTAGSWKADEIDTLDSVLSTLPSEFISCTGGIARNTKVLFGGNDERVGYYDDIKNVVHIEDLPTSEFKRTVLHEMCHAFQNKNSAIQDEWTAQFWSNGKPKTTSVTDYGNTNEAEDMAESVAEYWCNGPALKAQDPERYEFVKSKILGGKEYTEAQN